MDWPNENYVRLYTRNTTEWLCLSWQARGIFALLLRESDRRGVIELGRVGLRGLAAVLQAPWADLEGPIAELLEDGVIVEESEPKKRLRLPNYVEAQTCARSAAQRKREQRDRQRSWDEVTKRDRESQNVTECHERSQPVTNVTLHNATLHNATQRNAEVARAREAPSVPTSSSGFDDRALALGVAIRQQPELMAVVAHPERWVEKHLLPRWQDTDPRKLAAIREAIGEAAADTVTGEPAGETLKRLRRYCWQAVRGRPRTPQDAVSRPQPTMTPEEREKARQRAISAERQERAEHRAAMVYSGKAAGDLAAMLGGVADALSSPKAAE